MFLPPGFDKSIALESADLVQQAYKQFSDPAWQFPAADYQNLALLSATPAGHGAHQEPFGFVARNLATNHVFVVFRGTQTRADWLSNFSVPQTPFAYPGWGDVEVGFQNLYTQTVPSIDFALNGLPLETPIHVTGHSLGGALALLAAAGIRATHPDLKDLSLYTFAGPRAGDPAFATRFNSEIPDAFRVVNTEDIVTTLPLATVEIGGLKLSPLVQAALLPLNNLCYQHAGIPVTFTDNQGTITANHDMNLYIQAIT